MTTATCRAPSCEGQASPGVELRRCRLSGVDLSAARLNDVHLVECKLDEAGFAGATGERLRMDSCLLPRASLVGARIEHLRLYDCDLTEVDVSGARLDGARLHGSAIERLKGADGLRGVTIDSTQVVPFALRLFAARNIGVDDDRG